MNGEPLICPQCQSNTFVFLPNMQLHVAHGTQMLGMNVSVGGGVGGRFWTFTLVVCSHCTHTTIFTTNAQDLAQHIPGAKVGPLPARWW